MTETTCLKPTETIEKEAEETVFSNIRLSDCQCLIADKIVTKYKVTKNSSKLLKKEKISDEKSVITLPLREISKEELQIIRRSDIPSFLLKKDGKLFYTSIPKKMRFLNSHILGTHKCATEKITCSRLSAAPDELGGCAKVRNSCLAVDQMDQNEKLNTKKYIVGIEMYPWITEGYETFNMGRYLEFPNSTYDAFVVLECEHFSYNNPKEIKKDENDGTNIVNKSSSVNSKLKKSITKYGYGF